MKRKFFRGILTLLIVLAVVAGVIACGIYWAFFDIQQISGESVLQKTTSPNGTYTVTAYLNNGGATTDWAVLCSVENNETGRTKNLYWNYHCSTADIKWQDENTVIINDVALDVRKDTYDYRRD